MSGLFIVETNYLLVLVGVIFVAFGGYQIKSLTISGAIATIFVGFGVAFGFGYEGLVLLGIFFATSSFWSKFKSERKVELESKLQKGEQRDAIQVLANGGVPAFASVLYGYYPHELWLYIFVGAICTANADTWASELGTLSKRRPILITKLKSVDKGTSGAISLLGTIAAILGTILISFVALLFFETISISTALGLALIGFIGNFIDTLLGATVQVSYRCQICGIDTEKDVHCGRKTTYYKGVTFLNNDVINALSIFLASVIGGYILL